ncbi:PQQ-binding-like beta-propeller repeat protein [Streptomyces violens]|uniref:outer membrane protein assembly factor BamB family protein n=1 Tax=Streptomyces violens TaxID=66377 RepID=UPI0004BFF4F5|nr:PQQ-binding-like beta-propeller repeat protein [Streptomyces violens]
MGPEKQGGRGLTPAVAGDTVYSGGDKLVARSLTNGEQKWSRPVGGDGCGAPAVRGDLLYVPGITDLSTRRTKDGSEAWTLPLDVGSLSAEAPAAAGHSVWLPAGGQGEEGVSTADTRGGSLAWTYAPGTQGPWHLTTATNRVFLLQSGTLTAMPVF